jgi:hypothetical protein
MNDAFYRIRYHGANERASKAALDAIAAAERENNVAKALAAAYQGSQDRIDNRTAARAGLSRGGLESSKAVDRTNPPEFYEKKYRAKMGAEASEFDVARKMAEGVARSNPRVDMLLKFSKVAGPVGFAYGAYSSYNQISTATDKPYAITREVGGWVGGAYGASWGAAGGVALAVALGSNPVGWGILAAGAIVGMIGGAAGSMAGQYAAGTAYERVTTWLR